MVYRGLVLKVEENNILVFTNTCEYMKLKKKANIEVGKEIFFTQKDIIREKNKSYINLISIAAAIIFLMVATAGLLGIDFLGKFQTYAVVTLDINPSVEYEVDRNEIVKDIRPLNEEGKEITDDDMIGMEIGKVIYLSINNAREKRYLNEKNNVVLISNVVIRKDKNDTVKLKKEFINRIKQQEELKDIDIIYVESNRKDLKIARKNNISVGKYEIYKMIFQDNSNITIKQIKNKKISDIIKENKEIIQKVKKLKKDKEKINQKDIENDNLDRKKQEKKEYKKQEKNIIEKHNEKDDKEKAREKDKKIKQKKEIKKEKKSEFKNEVKKRLKNDKRKLSKDKKSR
ncbi:Anti-sigma factor N-terminus [Caminicella sporogenes DSM 14501]|uniref:Anti-sigma factor N-terminus n=1 Tax=Caminicella sporogenes DSM 14501 TaxID=1121266 RepID=A0A1M6QXV5_9FIRM|nr:anti-sigma factor domain-containing protein [Caminicella sporogenes]RKD20872.1 hypothetical protein BET04_08535 [Caminicella sporogenes]SHK24907.1 Anti-sigma factor N-terminus [Caminicella sporogenes DSM 14501]